MGKYDYMTSTNSAKAYYDNVKAPIKDFIVFEKSAHYPQFEEKIVFVDWLIPNLKIWRNIKEIQKHFQLQFNHHGRID